MNERLTEPATKGPRTFATKAAKPRLARLSMSETRDGYAGVAVEVICGKKLKRADRLQQILLVLGCCALAHSSAAENRLQGKG